MKNRVFRLWHLLLWFGLYVNAHAVQVTDNVNISGFGTFGVSTNDRDDILYRAQSESSLVEKGEFNTQTNTVIGLQGKVNFSDALSVTAQGLLRDHEEDDLKSELQWAYVQYDAPWDMTLRAGQFRLPIFHTTELAYVGYARSWANPALSFYGVGGFEFMQGVQLLYRTYYDAYDVTLRFNYGRSDDELPTSGAPNIKTLELETDNILIASAKFGTEHFWINTAYTQFASEEKAYDSDRNLLFRKSPKNRTYSVEYNVAFQGFDIEGGYAFADNEELPDERLMYHSVAYRIDNFKPYVLYSSKHFANHPEAETGGTLPPPVNLPDTLDDAKTRDIRWAVGMRYDLMNGVALKYQYETIDNSYSPLSTTNSSNDTGINRVHTLVLDWMF